MLRLALVISRYRLGLETGEISLPHRREQPRGIRPIAYQRISEKREIVWGQKQHTSSPQSNASRSLPRALRQLASNC